MVGGYYYNNAVKSIDNFIDKSFETSMTWEEANIQLDMFDPNVRAYFEKPNGESFVCTFVDKMVSYALGAYSWYCTCSYDKSSNIINCVTNFISSKSFVDELGGTFAMAHGFVKMLQNHNSYTYGKEPGDTLDMQAHQMLNRVIKLCIDNIGVHSIQLETN